MDVTVTLRKHITRKNVVTYMQEGPDPVVASVNLYKRIRNGPMPETITITIHDIEEDI